MVFILQMFTIIVSRGNVITLGEAYAFGVIWSFTFNSLAMLVLRWKYHGERGWKVPPNIRIGNFEIPIGLLSVFLVLLSTAIVNLFTKSVATVSGVLFAAAFFIIFTVSERANLRKHALTARQMKDQFQLEHQDTVSRESAAIRPGGVMVTMHDAANPFALKWTSGPHQHRRPGCGGNQCAHDGRGRTGVSERRRPELQRTRADGLYQGHLGGRELRQEGFPAGGSCRRCLRRAGAGRKFAGGGLGGLRSLQLMTAEDQAFHLGQAWEALPEPKRQFNFYVIGSNGETKVFYIGPHAPKLSPTTCNWCIGCG
jgi:hypothetical protein